MKKIDVSEYWLFDSDTNDALNNDELGVSSEEYDAAIIESVQSMTAEGHVYLNNRRVYAS